MLEKFFAAIESQQKASEEKIAAIELATEKRRTEDEYLRVAGYVATMEEIQRVINQGKDHKFGAPDGSQSINFLEKMAARINRPKFGLSDTGLNTESLSDSFDVDTRRELS